MLRLLVIRSEKVEECKKFYEFLGLIFKQERHGKGPLHYSTEISGGLVFEIYPLTKKNSEISNLRLGFDCENLAAVISKLALTSGIIAQPPTNSPWGRRAVLIDPEGRKVELYEKT